MNLAYLMGPAYWERPMTDWAKVKEMIAGMNDEEASKLGDLLEAELDSRRRKREKRAVKDVIGSVDKGWTQDMPGEEGST